MANSSQSNIRNLLMLLVVLVALGAPHASITLAVPAGAGTPDNFVEIEMFRDDDPFMPGAVFVMEIEVSLATLAEVFAVTGATLTLGDGGVNPLTDEDGDGRFWNFKGVYASLAEMQVATNGTWIVEVFGASPSTTDFTFNSAAFVDGDFFATPTGVTPAHGAVDVPPATVMSWNDTSGGTADGVFVKLENTVGSSGNVRDNSLNGMMSVTDTSWAPPMSMEIGFTHFEVVYADFDDHARVGAYNISAGSIVWGAAFFTPVGYPASTPLLTYEARTLVGFTVAGACPADTDASGTVNVTDLLALLAAWGPCGAPCPPDINTDGNVNVTDLLALLTAWGACP